MDLSLGQAKVDQINAKGVTIADWNEICPSAERLPNTRRRHSLYRDQQTAATPISGTFVNLPDGAIINATAGQPLAGELYGGDGNDLTLTVVP